VLHRITFHLFAADCSPQAFGYMHEAKHEDATGNGG